MTCKLKDLFPDAPSGETVITGMTADSRRVKPGYLFAALKGSVTDGSRFIPDAIEKGAAAILTGGDVDEVSVAHIIDDEPRRALALAAARHSWRAAAAAPTGSSPIYTCTAKVEKRRRSQATTARRL